VAEETAGRTEKAQKHKDLLLEGLHARLHAAAAGRALSAARLGEQRRETRAARELLAATAAEAEGVHYERRARGAQWRDSLLALQRRDEALKARPGPVPILRAAPTCVPVPPIRKGSYN